MTKKEKICFLKKKKQLQTIKKYDLLEVINYKFKEKKT